MIRIRNKDNKVLVSIETPDVTTISRVLDLEFNATSSLYAELLAKHLDAKFSEGLEQIREDAYTAGYRAGRDKKAKSSFFGYRWGFRFGDQR